MVTIGTPKAWISAIRICCRFANYIPAKLNADVVKIITDGSSHKFNIVRTQTAIEVRELLIEGGAYEFAAACILKKLIKDTQSSVQVFSFESLCWRIHSKQYFQAYILPLFTMSLELKNWRIRFVLVRQIAGILNSLDTKNRKQIISVFAKCLNDPEVEVAILALQSLKLIIGLLEIEDVIDKILPELTKVLTSENQDTKVALASSICSFSPIVSKNNDAFAQIKSIIMTLIKDPNQDLKINLLLNVEPYLKTVASQNSNLTFMAFINELLNDKNWKIRIDAIKALENLVIKFPEEFANDEKILKVFNEKLTDRISTIRKATILTLKVISTSQGTSWCERNCLPIINGLSENSSYLMRISFLLGALEIFPLLSAGRQARQIELVLKLAKDPVPNIRFLALMILLKIVQSGDDKSFEEKLRKTADGLSGDSDSEVRRIAKTIVQTKELKAITERLPELSL